MVEPGFALFSAGGFWIGAKKPEKTGTGWTVSVSWIGVLQFPASSRTRTPTVWVPTDSVLPKGGDEKLPPPPFSAELSPSPASLSTKSSPASASAAALALSVVVPPTTNFAGDSEAELSTGGVESGAPKAQVEACEVKTTKVASPVVVSSVRDERHGSGVALPLVAVQFGTGTPFLSTATSVYET